GLGTSFGRGGATTAQQDLANADCILIEGSSMAEAHPVGFRWVMKAKERGATVIHVDPRFSRTSALADIWVPIRAGSDIAFLGGLVRHLIENDLFFRDYVVPYTNASCILSDEYRDPEDNGDGYFSGWNEERRAYEGNSWLYKGGDLSRPLRDLTLQDPQCVFQKLRRHFSRYTPEIVEKTCGIPPELFHKVANALVAASGPERTAAICYAVGWTQHSKGVQIIRAAAILQLLLGNIGRPGGGILALRGHASIQGSTDIPTLYDMADGKMEGMFLIGQNSAVGAPNSRLQRKSMAKLKWFVIREMVETEPAKFWRDSAEIERGELKTEEIETEVFFFPAAGHAEKEGAFTNTQRLLQWREKAIDPPGDCRSDAWFIHQLALRLIAKAKASEDAIDEPLRALDWWYPEDEKGEPQMEAVLAEINGWY